jgi:hypothetical protein
VLLVVSCLFFVVMMMVGVGVLMCVVLSLVDVLFGSGCLLFVRCANMWFA